MIATYYSSELSCGLVEGRPQLGEKVDDLTLASILAGTAGKGEIGRFFGEGVIAADAIFRTKTDIFMLNVPILQSRLNPTQPKQPCTYIRNMENQCFILYLKFHI